VRGYGESRSRVLFRSRKVFTGGQNRADEKGGIARRFTLPIEGEGRVEASRVLLRFGFEKKSSLCTTR